MAGLVSHALPRPKHIAHLAAAPLPDADAARRRAPHTFALCQVRHECCQAVVVREHPPDLMHPTAPWCSSGQPRQRTSGGAHPKCHHTRHALAPQHGRQQPCAGGCVRTERTFSVSVCIGQSLTSSTLAYTCSSAMTCRVFWTWEWQTRTSPSSKHAAEARLQRRWRTQLNRLPVVIGAHARTCNRIHCQHDNRRRTQRTVPRCQHSLRCECGAAPPVSCLAA